MYQKEFMDWWEEHGQNVRAGGGEHERSFAYAAWNAARAGATKDAPAKHKEAPDLFSRGISKKLEDFKLRYGNDWTDKDKVDTLSLQSRLLLAVVAQDPIEVAALARVLWQRGEPTYSNGLTPKTTPDSLIAAAQAVIDRWDSPKWKDLPATGSYIHALRLALANAKEEEPDMRHPKIQRLTGGKARLEYEFSLIEQLIEQGPDIELTPTDTEYWGTVHDKLQKLLEFVPKERFWQVGAAN